MRNFATNYYVILPGNTSFSLHFKLCIPRCTRFPVVQYECSTDWTNSSFLVYDHFAITSSKNCRYSTIVNPSHTSMTSLPSCSSYSSSLVPTYLRTRRLYPSLPSLHAPTTGAETGRTFEEGDATQSFHHLRTPSEHARFLTDTLDEALLIAAQTNEACGLPDSVRSFRTSSSPADSRSSPPRRHQAGRHRHPVDDSCPAKGTSEHEAPQ